MSTSISDAMINAFQRSLYVGINIENILYGVELVLYSKTIFILLSNRRPHKKSTLFYAIFSSIMVFLVTILISTTAMFGENMWMQDPDFPGGADGFWVAKISIWYMDWGTTAVILLQLMTDGLLIYRCLIIWNSYRVIVLPLILWMSSLGLGVVTDWASSSPGGDFFTGIASHLSLAYYTVSVFLNMTLTCMICYRLVKHGRRIREHLGHEYASIYFTVVTLIVESALLYTLSGIAFLISLGMGSPSSVGLICVYLLMMCISPQMLILRVLTQRAWENDTSIPRNSAVEFDPGATSGSRWLESTGSHWQVQPLSKAYLPDGHNKVITSLV